MDAFYASVEQRDNPELQGKPVAVGGSKDRGVVAAASYEARKFGVKSAMSSSVAYKRCPEIVFVKPRFDVYQKVSEEIRAIFFEYSDLVEPLALDEAYGLNLKNQSLDDLTKWFGKAGTYYYDVVRGVDNRVVNPDRVRKSIGAERTFDQDYYSLIDLENQLENVYVILKERVLKAAKNGKTLTLKVKYADFTQITRSKTFPEVIDLSIFLRIGIELLRDVDNLDLGVRLIGLTLSNFEFDHNDQFLGQQMMLDY